MSIGDSPRVAKVARGSDGHEYLVLGVPSSAGAHWPGQEKAPDALRAAGLIEALAAAVVEDLGDVPKRVFRPDATERHARNAGAVLEVVEDVAARLQAVQANQRILVVGGDCSILLGVVAGLQRQVDEPLGLVYFDGHVDLNTPATSPSGILDSMGLAHLLGYGLPALTMLSQRFPMIAEHEVALIGFNEREMNLAEREALAANRFLAIPAEDVRRDPVTASRLATERAATAGRFIVHVDVDVIDFTDLPVADVPQFSEGLAAATVFGVLETLLTDDRCVGLCVTEFNPDRDQSGEYAQRFVTHLTAAIHRSRSTG